MKITMKVLTVFAVIAVLAAVGCSSGPKVKVVELENKGTALNVSTPDWIKTYTAYGMTRLQSQSAYRDKYCIIGEETGTNLQFVQAWADNFSAQQRIGAMLRTTIASEYTAKVQAAAQSAGLGDSATGESLYQQQIDNAISAIVNVSYSGAQREADWWSLRRRYDPDVDEAYSDAYTAYVLYTVPKAELNRQVARAMETSVASDSALYDITIELARDILQNGMPGWGAADAVTE
jgi:hypothetical protein